MININKKIYLCLLVTTSFLVTSCKKDKQQEYKKNTVFTYETKLKKQQTTPFYHEIDKSGINLLNDPLLQRIKDIDQSGPAHHFSYTIPAYSRLSHSIGVYNLLKKNNATKEECIAGLYHDVSHTVFSHTSDYLGEDYQKYVEESMHDSKLTTMLNNPTTEMILSEYKLTPYMIDASKNNFKMLDAPLPELCADRIEYTLHTAYILGLISLQQMQEMYNDVSFNHKLGYWYFNNDHCAFLFGYCSLILNLRFWAAPWCFQQNMHLAKALKIALKLKVITEEELFTLTDKEIILKLKSCTNYEVTRMIEHARIFTLDDKECPCQSDYELLHFKPKFRGVNPRVGVECKPYSEIGEFKTIFNLLYNEVKQYCRKGYWVAIAGTSIDNIASKCYNRIIDVL